MARYSDEFKATTVPCTLACKMKENRPNNRPCWERSFEECEGRRVCQQAMNLRSVNGLPGLSADTADLISIDSRSVRSRLLWLTLVSVRFCGSLPTFEYTVTATA